MTRPSAVTAPSAAAVAPRFDPAPVETETVARRAPAPPSAYEQTVRRDQVDLPVSLDETIVRAPAFDAAPPQQEEDAAPPRRRRTGLWIGLGAAALVIVAVIVGVSLPGILSGTAQEQPKPTESSKPQDPLSAVIPSVTDVVGSPVEGGVSFTWTNPDPQEGDHYLVTPVSVSDSDPEPEPVDVAEIVVPAAASGPTCVDVELVRANGQFQNEPTRGCTP